jgi:hypothetical protein
MRPRRFVMLAAVIGILGSLAAGIATATPTSKGPAAAPHTRQISGDVTAISCGSRALCEGVEVTPHSRFAYVHITHDGASARITTAKRSEQPSIVDCPSAAGCAALAQTSKFNYVEVPINSHGALGKPLYISPANSNSELNGIDCYRTRSHCTLVGQVGQQPSVVTIVGSTVTTHQLTLTGKILGGALNSVSCPTATKCFAAGYVGTETKQSGIIVTIVNGVPTGHVFAHAATDNGLRAISCVSASTCYATGFGAERSLVFTVHNGKVTHEVAAPKGVPLYDLSCEGAHTCYAVGSVPPKVSGNSFGAVLPIRNGKLGKLQRTSVTTLYAGGDTDSIEVESGFKGGIAIIGDDLRYEHKTILSIS